MTTKKTMRLKAATVHAAATREEAEQLLAEIGHLQRRAGEIEIAMNDELAAIKQRFEQEAAPLNEQVTAKLKALHMWAEVNREKLLDGRTKTCKLATGEISWKIRPPKVAIRGGQMVIAALKKHGLLDFVRTTEEVNKDAIQADPDRVAGIRGITIVRGVEDFVARPYESAIEIAEPVVKAA